MRLITFGAYGLATSEQTLAGDVHPAPDDRPINDEGQRLAVVDGVVTRVWDLRGFSAFGGSDGRTPGRIANDPAMIGKSWDDLAGLKTDDHPYGLLKVARPETAAEKKAREKAEADAVAAKELQRLANLTVPLFAIRKVFRETKAEDGASYLAKVEEAKVAGILSDDAYEAITMLDPVKRSSPYIAEFQTVFGFTDVQVDTLFLAAAAVPV